MDKFSIKNELSRTGQVTDRDLLVLAWWMLGCIFLLCVGVFGFYAVFPENDALKNIFEFIKVSIMPLVVLIVSFYFKNR